MVMMMMDVTMTVTMTMRPHQQNGIRAENVGISDGEVVSRCTGM